MFFISLSIFVFRASCIDIGGFLTPWSLTILFSSPFSFLSWCLLMYVFSYDNTLLHGIWVRFIHSISVVNASITIDTFVAWPSTPPFETLACSLLHMCHRLHDWSYVCMSTILVHALCAQSMNYLCASHVLTAPPMAPMLLMRRLLGLRIRYLCTPSTWQNVYSWIFVGDEEITMATSSGDWLYYHIPYKFPKISIQ